MERRSFLHIMISLLGASAALSLAYPLVRLLAPSSARSLQRLELKRDELQPGAARPITLNAVPGLVINRPGKGFVALSRVCTHLGCLVQYDKAAARLVCPCHSGVFDLDGNVVSGPPRKALTKIAVEVKGDRLLIG